jgi:hypothetical protein
VTMLSPKHDHADFPGGPNYGAKVEIFECAVIGWQLGIADHVINGCEDTQAIAHSGFAALSIIASYPEMYWQYTRNEDSRGISNRAWREAFVEMFGLDESESVRSAVDLVYRQLRCGLFHDGRTRANVLLSAGFERPIAIEDDVVLVNPHSLMPAILEHFREYIARLRQEGPESDLGTNFEARFDADYAGVW